MTLDLFPFTSVELAKLNKLTVEDCRLLQTWLTERISFLENEGKTEIQIRTLNLSVRAYNALMAEKLTTIKEVVDYGLENVWKLRNVGPKTVHEIIDAVQASMKKGID